MINIENSYEEVGKFLDDHEDCSSLIHKKIMKEHAKFMEETFNLIERFFDNAKKFESINEIYNVSKLQNINIIILITFIY